MYVNVDLVVYYDSDSDSDSGCCGDYVGSDCGCVGGGHVIIL